MTESTTRGSNGSGSSPRARFDPVPVVVGLVLVALGVLFLLDQAGSIDAGRLIGDWWPLVIVAIGLAQFVANPRSQVVALIVMGFGLILLLSQLDLIGRDVWNYLWPAVLVAIGVVLIVRAPGRNLPAGIGDAVIRTTALFGSNELVVTSQKFGGGAATAIFGEVVVDLRPANLDPGGATLAATALFGAVEVLVPRGWRVDANGTPIFGGLSNQVDPPAAGAATLRVDVTSLFAGVTIKHDK